MINFGFDSALSVDDNGDMVVPYPNLFSKELYWFEMSKYIDKYGSFPINNNILEKDDLLLLNGRSICVNLNNDLFSYKKDTVENYIIRDESFIYSILIWNNELFEGGVDITLPEKIKQQIKLGKCKFVIFYITEPWFMYQYCYEWISNFADENGLTKNDFIFVSSNLVASEVRKKYVKENIIKDNFNIIEFNYFFLIIWFYKHNYHRDFSQNLYQKKLEENLKKQKETKKEKHFLCFNRKPHDHRVSIFAEVMTNPKLKDKTIITLGNENLIRGQKHKEAIRRFIDSNYKHGHERLYNFIDNYCSDKDYIYDTNSLVDEQSSNINLDVHTITFCNIVTETLTEENLLFFSEKIIKPIFSLQPFIIIGNRNSLKKLKEYGFKTFDRWWDESYDESFYQNRFEKVVELLMEISKWDDNKINQTLLEMEDTLIHNFKMLIEDKSTREFFNTFLKVI
jgi:hypothetical protein